MLQLLIMSEMKRLTLVSDPTNEFPNNANNSFKVRLPERLVLPGAGWHASLMSLTVPDQGQSNAIIAADPHTKVVRFKYPQIIRKWTDTGNPSTSGYLRVEAPLLNGQIELEDVLNANQIVATGTDFWKRVSQEVHNFTMKTLVAQQNNLMINDRDSKPIVSIKKHAMPRLTWKEDALVIHGVAQKDLINVGQVNVVEFYINLDIALKFGLLTRKTGKTANVTGSFDIGPNLQFTAPAGNYNETTSPVGSQQRRFYNWEGEQYMGVRQTSRAFTITTMDNVVWMRLYMGFEWQINNLNASFEKIVGTRKRTVMVYSDLVESTVVGSGKFPLLREVQLLRTGDGESTAEPLHHQWIKVRGQQLDILEVEIASTSGPLAILPPGKTLVTIGLKQL